MLEVGRELVHAATSGLSAPMTKATVANRFGVVCPRAVGAAGVEAALPERLRVLEPLQAPTVTHDMRNLYRKVMKTSS